MMKQLSINGLLNQRSHEIFSQLRVPRYQLKSLKNIQRCRTKALGGHAQYCENGHLNGVWYNSCKQRGCPQCQSLATEQWLQNTSSLLLACPHHHIIFTIPSELNTLWSFNRELMSDILFKASQETIKSFARDRRYLQAMPGMISALHTWGRNLSLHPHIHMLVTHGGLDSEDQWVEPKKEVLFPQKPVMMVFRGKLLSRIAKALDKNQVVVPPEESIQRVRNLVHLLGRKRWVVHFCQRYDHAKGVAKYLARYIKRGPLNNSQLKFCEEGKVKFQYKSHQTKRLETQTLSEAQFYRQYAQHAALPGRPSVRYGGLYVSSVREKLNVARAQRLQVPVPARERLDWLEYLEASGGLPRCKECNGLLNQSGPLPEIH